MERCPPRSSRGLVGPTVRSGVGDPPPGWIRLERPSVAVARTAAGCPLECPFDLPPGAKISHKSGSLLLRMHELRIFFFHPQSRAPLGDAGRRLRGNVKGTRPSLVHLRGASARPPMSRRPRGVSAVWCPLQVQSRCTCCTGRVPVSGGFGVVRVTPSTLHALFTKVT